MPIKEKKDCQKAINVANYLVFLSSQENKEGEVEGVTNLKLQKLLYFSQAYYLAKFNKALFHEEIEAWDLGPVVPEVYRHFKERKRNPIIKEEDESYLAKEDKENLKKVWDAFGIYSAGKLVDIVHSHAPWKEARESKRNQIISRKTIKDYYKPLFDN